MSLSINSTANEPCYQFVNNNAPQEWLQDTFLWAASRHLNAPGRSTKSHRSQLALQGSSSPPYDGVINPMFSKSNTHGVIGGVIKCPFSV